MPSVGGLQRSKANSFYIPEIVTIVQDTDQHSAAVGAPHQSQEQTTLSHSPSSTPRHTPDSQSGVDSRCLSEGMNTAPNPGLVREGALLQGHPIDELTNVPVDTRGRTDQLLIPDSNSSSSEFGPFVSGLPDELRHRSNSFNTSLLRGGGHASPAFSNPAPLPPPVIDPLHRYSEPNILTKTGSMDNVAAPVVAQLRHSHTLAEIPPQALSNDSGYHTPPNRQHGHTSPPWPTGMHMQWPAHVSPPTCGTPQYFQGRPVAAQRTSAPTPLNQNLTVDTGDPSGHYQPEPSTPQIVIGHPITYSHHSAVPQPHYMTPTSYNRGHDPYHSLPPAQAATPVPAPSPEEANILGYQQDRKNRLFHACVQEETEITKIKEEEEGLLKLLEEERKTNEGVDSEMEKGVTNMTNENKRLASDIQRLTQRLSNPQVRGPIHGYLPLQPPPPPPVSQSAITRPPIPIYNPNDPMINNTPTAPLRPTRVPPPVPPRRSPSRVAEEEEWSCSGCTFLNHPLIASCEICQTPRQTTSRPGSNVL